MATGSAQLDNDLSNRPSAAQERGLVSLAKRGINAVLDVPHQLCGMFLSISHEQSAFVSTDVVRGPEK